MTLMDALRRGDIPVQVREVAGRESVPLDKLVASLLAGHSVIPSNSGLAEPRLCGVGEGLRTKVNANIGTSAGYPEMEPEMRKLRVAVAAGADAVMDLSTGGPIAEIRAAMVAASAVPVGTVPIYQAAVRATEERGSIVAMRPDDMFRAIEDHCASGVDFITVHCGITLRVLEALRRQGRVTDVVSRGGAFLAGWMLANERENPLYEQFDRLLELARAYDVTLSLGDGMRPGSIADATDRSQLEELVELGSLVPRCREAGVQCMVEGPGHVPLNQVEANIRLAKAVTGGAPFYVLGPLVTDVAAGYDHITAAIGGALAGMSGADFLCFVTPREHLGLPTEQDVHEGVMVTRIAAHAADLAKGVPGAAAWDLEMSEARKRLDWERQLELAIDPEKARGMYRERSRGEETCSMCGEFCAMRFIGTYLGRDMPVC
ncbi:MAG: phosphomethylpyrimidine synthase ThiC [Candidatus Geothermincolia bacterium]